MAATGEIEKLTVFGTDYPTPDGTCIRDYIHVLDLGEAHVAALRYLRSDGETTAVNLGTGRGASVKEIITYAEQISGKRITVDYGPRRPGDPPELVAAPVKAKSVLGWQAKFKEPRDIVASAWSWISGPRQGRYEK